MSKWTNSVALYFTYKCTQVVCVPLLDVPVLTTQSLEQQQQRKKYDPLFGSIEIAFKRFINVITCVPTFLHFWYLMWEWRGERIWAENSEHTEHWPYSKTKLDAKRTKTWRNKRESEVCMCALEFTLKWNEKHFAMSINTSFNSMTQRQRYRIQHKRTQNILNSCWKIEKQCTHCRRFVHLL